MDEETDINYLKGLSQKTILFCPHYMMRRLLKLCSIYGIELTLAPNRYLLDGHYTCRHDSELIAYDPGSLTVLEEEAFERAVAKIEHEQAALMEMTEPKFRQFMRYFYGDGFSPSVAPVAMIEFVRGCIITEGFYMKDELRIQCGLPEPAKTDATRIVSGGVAWWWRRGQKAKEDYNAITSSDS